ncbi:MAG: 2TM domain-containing protein [Flavobacteriaceae bacterium]|nr:2TM domain-containing protein [Flavobacteriaceae bacterium]
MNKKYLQAKKRVRSLQYFYIHLFLFLIVNIALMFKLILLEKDESLNFFVWVVLNFMVTWSIVMLVHVWLIFKDSIIFSRAYQNKLTQELMKANQKE